MGDEGWEPVGHGFNQAVNVLQEHQGSIYAGGAFWRSGPSSMRAISQWTGEEWAPVGDGLVGEVIDLATGPDGSLIAAGDLSFIAGGDALSHVASWNGEQWTPTGEGLDAHVNTLHVGDIGTGSQLFAGGAFTSNVSTFIDGTWSSLGAGPGGPVYDLIIADVGNGPQLIAAGDFGATDAGALAVWDGSAWTPLAGGLAQSNGSPQARALAIDPSSGALVVGGRFDHAGGVPSKNIAMLALCSDTHPADFDGDGVVGAGDLAVILAAWGGTSADLDGDNIVGAGDLAVLLAAWN